MSSAPWQAVTSLGLACLFLHPLDLFAFIHTLGNCKDSMRAITNSSSQEEVPGGAMFFLIWEVCILSFCLQILYISLAFLCFFVLLWRHILNSQQDFSLWYSRVKTTDKINTDSSVFKLSAVLVSYFPFLPNYVQIYKRSFSWFFTYNLSPVVAATFDCLLHPCMWEFSVRVLVWMTWMLTSLWYWQSWVYNHNLSQ